MTPFAHSLELEDIARRIIWFEQPDEALRDPIRFMAYAFRYATPSDMQVLRKNVSDDDLRAALSQAPPGIIDARSWSYWNAIFGIFPPPPMPVRHLE
jgi:hypothetical protein